MNVQLKKKLDYIPFAALLLSAIYLLYVRMNGEVLIQARHIAALIFLIIAWTIVVVRHKIGVLLLGFLVILGLFGALSFSPTISVITVNVPIGKEAVPILYFQPVFLLWATLHFAISGRYYTGILSKKYWMEIKSNAPFRID